jgi:hypothetical protein
MPQQVKAAMADAMTIQLRSPKLLFAAQTVVDLETALARLAEGLSTGAAYDWRDGCVMKDAVKVDLLLSALAQMAAVPWNTLEGSQIIKQSEITLELRKALLADEWATVATYLQIAVSSGFASNEVLAIQQGKARRDELLALHESITSQLQRGYSRTWQIDKVEVVELMLAAAKAKTVLTFPEFNLPLATLITEAEIVGKLRQAILLEQWQDLRDGLLAAEHLGLQSEEIKLMQLKLHDVMEFPHIVTELDVAYELRDENALRLGLEALAAQGFDVHNAPWRNFALEVSIVKKAQEMLETITRVRLHLQEARLTMNMESMKAALDEAQLIMYQPEQVPTRTSLQLTPIAAVPCTLRWLAHVRVCFIRWSSFASCIQV